MASATKIDETKTKREASALSIFAGWKRMQGLLLFQLLVDDRWKPSLRLYLEHLDLVLFL